MRAGWRRVVVLAVVSTGACDARQAITPAVADLTPATTVGPPAPWRVSDSVPLTRYEHATAVIGRELFFIGGFYNEATQATVQVDVLHLDTGVWRQAAEMPIPLTHVNAVVLGDTAIWIVGGFRGDHPGPAVAETWRYRVAADRWVAGPPLPAPRGGGLTLARGDTLHFAGGWLPDRNTDSPDHWMLRPGATTWEPRAPIPSPRGHLSGFVYDGHLYAVGGNIGHDPIPVDVPFVHVYDPVHDRWSEAPPLARPHTHTEPGTVWWRDRALFIGGRDLTSWRWNLDEIVSWNPTSGRSRLEALMPVGLLAPTGVVVGDTLVVGAGAPRINNPTNPLIWRAPLLGAWHRLPALPAALGEVSAAVMGDRLFLLGQGHRMTWMFDLARGRWEPADRWAARPIPGHHHGAEVLGGELWLLGGLGASGSRGMVQVFNPARNAWRLGPPLPRRVGAAATAMIDGRLYVAGGIAGDHTVQDAWVLDPRDSVWQPIAPLPWPRNHAAAATDGVRFYLFGGRGPDSGDGEMVANGYDDVQIYDPRTDRWVTSDGSPGSPPPLPVRRGGMGKAVFLHGEFWVIGGETLDGPGANAGGTFSRVDIYDPQRNTWREGPPLQVARHGIFPVIDDGRILVVGGSEVRGEGSSTVFEVLRPR